VRDSSSPRETTTAAVSGIAEFREARACGDERRAGERCPKSETDDRRKETETGGNLETEHGGG
jgi:hypothetical protein